MPQILLEFYSFVVPVEFSLFAVSLLKMVDVNHSSPVMVVTFMMGDFVLFGFNAVGETILTMHPNFALSQLKLDNPARADVLDHRRLLHQTKR
ncbi:hypothetical protein NIES4071_88480 [Calothrix sp. NIES-4071]|nr:hypothetical protein NIES4071_88480 [Calothrix sp. NIES-4071]BAZ63115.1 hypothetical protein NIES4105_88410 [Calothrix sp. NIES-4105]